MYVCVYIHIPMYIYIYVGDGSDEADVQSTHTVFLMCS